METQNTEPLVPQETLEEMSAMELNDKIVLLSTFLCKKCNTFLNRPIMLVATIGNVCGYCVDDEPYTSIHNVALEAVLEILLVPCRYYNEGCRKKLPYIEMSAHVSMCCYRNYCCPLVSCMWEGRFTELLHHGISCHQDFVIYGESNIVKLELDISKDKEIVNLLNIDNNMFILHIESNLQTLKQHYGIYYIGAAEKAQEFLYSIVQTGCSGLGSIHLGSGNVLRDVDFKRCIDVNSCVVDFALIKPLVNDNIMSVQIKVVLKDEADEVQTELLTNFECPVCNNYMRPPIFQCLSGHSICNVCRPQLNQCPTCRCGFGCTRNFTLESISGNIKFPCINRDNGCRAVLKHTDADKHEAECPLKSYSCPFNKYMDCISLVGPLKDLIDHLKTNHQDKLIFGNYNKVSVPFSIDTNFFLVYCMIFNEEVFRVCYKRDSRSQNSFWAVQLIGPRGECKNYRNEIGLIDGRNEHRRLVRVDLVQDLSNPDTMFNQCITIPSTTVSWFNLSGQITYYCKIARIK